MGHSDLLVTQTLHGQPCWGRPRGSVRRASGLVQTGFEEVNERGSGRIVGDPFILCLAKMITLRISARKLIEYC
jgi:hypothetical protein